MSGKGTGRMSCRVRGQVVSGNRGNGHLWRVSRLELTVAAEALVGVVLGDPPGEDGGDLAGLADSAVSIQESSKTSICPTPSFVLTTHTAASNSTSAITYACALPAHRTG
jgi:hypothetical protein